jgi:hypothetical protein
MARKKSVVERLEALRNPLERATEKVGKLAESVTNGGMGPKTQVERKRVESEKTVLLKEIKRMEQLLKSF